MKTILDLHIHSKYSRACSKELEPAKIDQACRIKGVDIIATGDFTHPAWLKSLSSELEETGRSGLYRLKTAPDEKVKFIFSTEVSLIYKQGDKTRRVHLVLMAPDLAAARALSERLGKYYNIKSDGRPILGLSAPRLMEICLDTDPDFVVYPAHIWTPWFSVFGSKSGFDRMEDCFGEYAKNIRAIETGLSSDPEMNWRWSALDEFTILSNSDAHSLRNIAREANVMDLPEQSFAAIRNAISNKAGMLFTIEFYPEEGMYHFDGHRACAVRLKPEEARINQGICPACGKPLTIGVLNRVEELADRPEGARPGSAVDFRKLVELDKIIAESLGVKSRTSKKVEAIYNRLIQALGSELSILLDAPIPDIAAVAGERAAEAVRRVRAGQLTVEPGFDGVYGTVKIFTKDEKDRPQLELF